MPREFIKTRPEACVRLAGFDLRVREGVAARETEAVEPCRFKKEFHAAGPHLAVIHILIKVRVVRNRLNFLCELILKVRVEESQRHRTQRIFLQRRGEFVVEALFRLQIRVPDVVIRRAGTAAVVIHTVIEVLHGGRLITA